MSPAPEQVVWATRGRSWGFRFLLDGGLDDPLPAYERAFADLRDAPTAYRREGTRVALRIQDPWGRRDASGRPIPHEFVLLGELADVVHSVEDGLASVWPLVADAYATTWDGPNPPAAEDLRFSDR